MLSNTKRFSAENCQYPKVYNTLLGILGAWHDRLSFLVATGANGVSNWTGMDCDSPNVYVISLELLGRLHTSCHLCHIYIA
jgi:hypothetical protein